MGEVTGTDRLGFKFKGKVYDLIKNAQDKGISVDKKPIEWEPGREDVSFLGETKSFLTEREIVALGEFAIRLYPSSRPLSPWAANTEISWTSRAAIDHW